MKLVALVENTACRDGLAAEHGLSLYLEVENKKILFDMGQSQAFGDNAERLGIDLSQVDLAVLSHGHYDHGGGLARFLEINEKAPVYLSTHAFGGHYNGQEKYIGLNPALKDSSRLIFVDQVTEIGKGLTLHPGMLLPVRLPIDPAGLTRREGERFLPEDFRHEQYLLIQEGEKRILLSGCSHRGILNIAAHFQPDVLVGGFHFMKLAAEGDTIQAAAEELLRWPTQYYTCHCTGAAQYEAMKKSMGDRLQYLSAGMTLEL